MPRDVHGQPQHNNDAVPACPTKNVSEHARGRSFATPNPPVRQSLVICFMAIAPTTLGARQRQGASAAAAITAANAIPPPSNIGFVFNLPDAITIAAHRQRSETRARQHQFRCSNRRSTSCCHTSDLSTSAPSWSVRYKDFRTDFSSATIVSRQRSGRSRRRRSSPVQHCSRRRCWQSGPLPAADSLLQRINNKHNLQYTIASYRYAHHHHHR
jgi:hypothetical protein